LNFAYLGTIQTNSSTVIAGGRGEGEGMTRGKCDWNISSNSLTFLEFGNYFVRGFVGKDIRDRSEVVVIGYDGCAANGMSGDGVRKVCSILYGREKPGFENLFLTTRNGDVKQAAVQDGKQCLTG
jgi:hypothetical protein